jgi:hypothetical protein
MRIRFECRHCSAGLTASDWDSGRAILCSTCNRENIVPAEKAPALEVGIAADQGVPNLAIDRPARWKPHRRNYFLWGIAWSGIAVVAIGVCFLGMGVLLNRSTRIAGNDLLPPAVDAPLGVRPAAQFAEFSTPADEKIFKALAETPVKGLDHEMFVQLKQTRPKLGEHPLAMMVAKNPSKGVGMPFTFGTDCTSSDQHARDLGKASVALHVMLDGSTRGSRGEMFAERMEQDPRWLKPEMVPSLTQILMAEDVNWRMTLARMLTKIEGPAATRGLVDRAVFDMNANVRSEAVKSLRSRPNAEYTERLMSAFRHPWAPAADHAAQAVVMLNRTDLQGELRDLVDRPEPTAPTKKRIGIREVTVAPQLVRVNHLRNCMYCHPVSTSSEEAVRGVSPDWDLPLTPRYYGESGPSTFVRADMVYLRQDFSLTMPVGGEDCKNDWPKEQRFDFFVCDRTLSAEEAASYVAPATYPQREAVKSALARLEQASK